RPGTGGVFEIRLDGELIWERKRDGGFPDAKQLKQMVRDRIDPDRDLGHIDRPHGPSALHLRTPETSCAAAGMRHSWHQPRAARTSQGGCRLMKPLLLALAASPTLLAPAAGQDLPARGGRTIRAVTENAYPPLNFADPATGEGIGWEYDAVN